MYGGSGGSPCASSSASMLPCSRAMTRMPSGSAPRTRSRTPPARRRGRLADQLPGQVVIELVNVHGPLVYMLASVDTFNGLLELADLAAGRHRLIDGQ